MRNKEPLLQPKNAVIRTDDELIVLMASSEHRPEPTRAKPSGREPPRFEAPSAPAERILILGWNARGPQIIDDLPHYAPAGSSVLVVYDPSAVNTDVRLMCGSQGLLVVECQAGDTRSPQALRALDVDACDHIIVLGYTERLDRNEADTRTLLTLLHLRQLLQSAERRPTIVSEMLDVRHRDLADQEGLDDFVVSDHLISLMLAQVAENDCARKVLDQLLSPQDSEIYLRAAKLYLWPGEDTSFLDIMAAARAKGQIAIGYRRHSLRNDRKRNYGVELNPKKSRLYRLEEGDKVIVLAPGEDQWRTRT